MSSVARPTWPDMDRPSKPDDQATVRALICGAGIAGLTLARLLSQQGWSVCVAERASALRREGYMIDFFGPGFEAAEAMGLLPRLRQLAYQVSEVSYVDRNGRPRAALDYERIAGSLKGQMLGCGG